MANKHPVNNFVKFMQVSFAAGVGGLGGYSIYFYFNMYGLISNGGILPLIGCGISCFAAFWSFFAVGSRNPYFHFGIAKLFLGGLIVTAWGSSSVANWLCSDAGEEGFNCDPASEANPGWTTGITTAAFDGIEFILFLATCIICVRHPRTRTQTDTPGDRMRDFWADIRNEAYKESLRNVETSMSRLEDQTRNIELQMINSMRNLA